MATMDFANIFARDMDLLTEFYMSTFGFEELLEWRSPIYRALETGRSILGFNATEAYELLELQALANPTGSKLLLNFMVENESDVASATERAVTKGGRLVKAPYRTYYNWIQSVLLDPEGNPFRINKVNPWIKD